MPRKRPTPIPWEEVPPELDYMKLSPEIVKTIEGICATDAARGKAAWALMLCFFTGRDDLVPLTGDAEKAFLGAKMSISFLRRSILNGKKGGNPNLIKGKSPTKDEQSTDKVPTKYKQGTDKVQGPEDADMFF